MPITMTMLARKGGSGRTTTAVNLAGVFVRRGARVLCIDLDGQASLSRVFFGSGKVESLDPTTTVAAVLAGYGSEPSEVIHDTDIPGLSVVPASDALEPLAMPGVGDNSKCLSELIKSLTAFDLVIIDTPPATGVSTTYAALNASDAVLCPTVPDSFGTQSIISCQRAVEDAAKTNQRVKILGYVLNQIQRNGLCDGYCQAVRQLHGGQVFDTEIPQAVAYREAMALRKPITYYKPKVAAAKIMESLADEIEKRMNKKSSTRRAA